MRIFLCLERRKTVFKKAHRTLLDQADSLIDERPLTPCFVKTEAIVLDLVGCSETQEATNHVP